MLYSKICEYQGLYFNFGDTVHKLNIFDVMDGPECFLGVLAMEDIIYGFLVVLRYTGGYKSFAEGFPEQMSCVVCGGRSKYSWGAKRKMVLARPVEDFQSG